ncbi:MAG: hypothetical protein ABR875_02385 [Minisyncoccia bacterium]
MTDNLVGAVPDDNLGIVEDVARRLRKEKGFPERIKLFLAGKLQPAEGVKIIPRPFAKLDRMLSRRFGERIYVNPYPKEFTPEFLANAVKYNMRPVFWPGKDMIPDLRLKKWIMPNAWFYNQVFAGKIKSHGDLSPTKLQRGWYLADFTIGADYTDGTQVFIDDPFAPIIAKLREQKLVGKYDNTPVGSRFSIARNEWQDCVLAHIASALNVTRSQIRLERAIEFNAIGNLYDPNRGKFKMWEWFADHFGGSGRLVGGSRGVGGLAGVCCVWFCDWNDDIAARPLVSFVS